MIFPSDPVLQHVFAETWEVHEDWCWPETENSWWMVRNGFRTDLASIPRIFWRVIGHPASGDVVAASVLHDALYRVQVTTRAEADERLYRAMLARGANRAKAWAVWLGVRTGGWVAWNAVKPADKIAGRKLVTLETSPL